MRRGGQHAQPNIQRGGQHMQRGGNARKEGKGGRPGAVRAERGRSAQSGEAGTARAQTEAAHSESRGGDV